MKKREGGGRKRDSFRCARVFALPRLKLTKMKSQRIVNTPPEDKKTFLADAEHFDYRSIKNTLFCYFLFLSCVCDTQ
jgi:hypothetical protein